MVGCGCRCELQTGSCNLVIYLVVLLSSLGCSSHDGLNDIVLMLHIGDRFLLNFDPVFTFDPQVGSVLTHFLSLWIHFTLKSGHCSSKP